MISAWSQQAAQLLVSLTGPSQNKFLREERTTVARMLMQAVYMVEGLEKFVDKTQQLGDRLG